MNAHFLSIRTSTRQTTFQNQPSREYGFFSSAYSKIFQRIIACIFKQSSAQLQSQPLVVNISFHPCGTLTWKATRVHGQRKDSSQRGLPPIIGPDVTATPVGVRQGKGCPLFSLANRAINKENKVNRCICTTYIQTYLVAAGMQERIYANGTWVAQPSLPGTI